MQFSTSPFAMPTQPYSSTFAYSPVAQPMIPSSYTAYQYTSDTQASSSSSGGSTFSSPSSYADSSPLPQLAYPFPGMARSRSPPPQMSIDMSLLDGGAGYEDLLQYQNDRVQSGFTGFFAGNGDGLKGVAVEAAGIPNHLVRQPTFQARRASFAESDVSYESDMEPMVAISSTMLSDEQPRIKRERSSPPPPAAEVAFRPTKRAPATSDSVSSPPASKRRKSSTTSSSHAIERDLPPLPADFDTFGPGGSSLFDDSPGSSSSRTARATTPDFSGRDDCWGIGPEAYARLSAKAKKQLRCVTGLLLGCYMRGNALTADLFLSV